VTKADPHAELMRSVGLHAHLGFKIVRIDPEGTVVEMPVHPPALNGSGNLHGGAIATLIDVACGMAAGSASGIDRSQQTLVTADVHIRYLGRPKTSTVRGEGRVVRVGRQLVVVEGRVVDTAGNVIAAADAAFMVVPLRRPLDVANNVDPQALDL
jgi:uncharacterized protein (TIGR00369 family)